MKIVIAEPLRAAGIDILRAQPDWEIVISSPGEYQQHLADADVLLTNMPGESAVAVAEHTLGLMLAMARQIPQAIDSTRHGKWEGKRFLGTELRRKTLGVMGLGSIGREVVRRARGFEMKIIAND